MTKNERRAIMEHAEKTNYGEAVWDLSYAVGEAVNADPHAILTQDQATAFIKWQCRCLDGSWDLSALNENFDFLAKARLVMDGGNPQYWLSMEA